MNQIPHCRRRICAGALWASCRLDFALPYHAFSLSASLQRKSGVARASGATGGGGAGRGRKSSMLAQLGALRITAAAHQRPSPIDQPASSKQAGRQSGQRTTNNEQRASRNGAVDRPYRARQRSAAERTLLCKVGTYLLDRTRSEVAKDDWTAQSKGNGVMERRRRSNKSRSGLACLPACLPALPGLALIHQISRVPICGYDGLSPHRKVITAF